jgi:hypothetical protein
MRGAASAAALAASAAARRPLGARAFASGAGVPDDLRSAFAYCVQQVM